MLLEIRKHGEGEDSISTIHGECQECKRGYNSLVILNTVALTPNVYKLTIKCIACQTLFKTKVKQR